MPSEVTNRQDEVKKNDKKASINVLQKKYVYDLEREWNNYARRLAQGESFLQFTFHKERGSGDPLF